MMTEDQWQQQQQQQHQRHHHTITQPKHVAENRTAPDCGKCGIKLIFLRKLIHVGLNTKNHNYKEEVHLLSV